MWNDKKEEELGRVRVCVCCSHCFYVDYLPVKNRLRRGRVSVCFDVDYLPESRRSRADSGNVDRVDGWCYETKCWCLVMVVEKVS